MIKTWTIPFSLLIVFALPAITLGDSGESAMPEIPNKVQPDDKTLIGGQPEQEHFRQARDEGVRTVVNFRGTGEFDDWEASELSARLGMLYIHIPVDGAGGLTRQSVEAFDRAVRAAGEEPAMYYCASGNRVGAMFALRAGFLEGQSTEDALEIGRRHGLTGLEDTVRGMLESGELPDA